VATTTRFPTIVPTSGENTPQTPAKFLGSGTRLPPDDFDEIPGPDHSGIDLGVPRNAGSGW